MIEPFVKKNWDKKSPLLLGCSGGPDSKALLYLLLQSKVKNLHVAHVDHGWRKESSQEAKSLQEEVEGLGLVFHVKKLSPAVKNKEAAAREERLEFFRSLFALFPYQALLLAHQEEDLAENALKRVLEGAHLPFLAGMKKVSQIEGLPVWRPLLDIQKEKILDFLHKEKIGYFLDATNKDPIYLRARIREKILPDLSRQFGKGIVENLKVLAKRGSELQEYLDRKIEKIPSLKGPWGEAIDLSGIERVEARYLMQKKTKGLSRHLLERLLDSVEGKKANVSIRPHIFSHQGWVFLLNEAIPKFVDQEELALGSFTLGSWHIEIAPFPPKEGPNPPFPDWKDVWAGKFSLVLPKGVYALKKLAPGEGKKVKKLWSEKKIFSFLRENVPVLKEKRGAFYEFLSGRGRKISDQGLRLNFKHLNFK